MARFARSLAVLALGAGVVAAGFALARGPDMSLPGLSSSSGNVGGSWLASPEPAAQAPVRHVRISPDDEDRPARHKHIASASASVGGSYHGAYNGRAVCVRLCDGSFFPATSTAAGDAGCAAQCPGAPTELYAMTSDRIEESYAMTSGAPYAKLPVASRFQQSHENTCSCHRDGVVAHAKELLHDSSLRKGDVVMTADGFKVFEGSGWGPTKPQDFVTVSKAGLPREESAQLLDMEHASASRIAPAAPPTVVAERTKGNVTVDDGPK
jgi:hypothetical protein